MTKKQTKTAEAIELIRKHKRLYQSDLWKMIKIDDRLMSVIVKDLISKNQISRSKVQKDGYATFVLEHKSTPVESPCWGCNCSEDEYKLKYCVKITEWAMNHK